MSVENERVNLFGRPFISREVATIEELGEPRPSAGTGLARLTVAMTDELFNYTRDRRTEDFVVSPIAG